MDPRIEVDEAERPVPSMRRRRRMAGTGIRPAAAAPAVAIVVVAVCALAYTLWPRDHARQLPRADAGPKLHATPTNLKRIFRSAPGGATILLASGNYGSFAAGARPSPVTIRPEPGAAARMSLAFSPAANVRLEGLTIDGATIAGPSHHVTIARSVFRGQIVIHAEQMTAANVVLDGNRLANIDACPDCYEGRVHVLGDSGRPSGIVIRNNIIGPGGESDGIQISGNGVQVLHNTFVGIRQPSSGRHIDALQLYGQRNTVVRGNYFRDVATGIMAPDGGDHELIEGNVIDTGGYPFAIMLGGDDGSVIRHNTIPDVRRCAWDAPCGTLLIGAGPTGRPSRGTVVEDNILGQLSVNGNSVIRVQRRNLVGQGAGPDDLSGRPTFAGGAGPTSLLGFELAPGSLGKRAAPGGVDVGVTAGGSRAAGGSS